MKRNMAQNIKLQKELTRFINYHNRPHSSSYNTIESIVCSQDIRSGIKFVTELLKLKTIFIDYSQNVEIKNFLKDWANSLISGNITIIFTKNKDFHPVLFDQFMHYRESNSFNFIDKQYEGDNWCTKSISPDAHLFLIFQEPKADKVDQKIYDLSDHILDLRPFED